MPLNDDGFELVEDFISAEVADSIINETETELATIKGGGIRNADKKFQSIATLANSKKILSQATKYLKGKPNLVRAVLFDKSPANNWLVTWHQDKTVALSSTFEMTGWGPWSVKDEVHHVQPPLDVLEEMVTFRIHLDESTLKNGCIKVVSGSHQYGVLTQEEIYRLTTSREVISVVAPLKSALVMRPHLLHSSSKAIEPSKRRVLHLEYSSYQLPNGVYWA